MLTGILILCRNMSKKETNKIRQNVENKGRIVDKKQKI